MSSSFRLNTRYYRLYPSNQFLGYGYENYVVDMDRTAFLVVDVYGLRITSGRPQTILCARSTYGWGSSSINMAWQR